MKGIDTGKDKVKKICDVLKRETLEPARKEAEEIISTAEIKAQQIIQEAKKEAEKIFSEARKEIEKEKNVFQSSLNQACKQALEVLKQDIESKLFNPELSKLLHQPLQEPQVLADLIKAVVGALEKEGTDADLTAIIPKAVAAETVNCLLSKNILQRLKSHSVQVGSREGGIAVKIDKDNITMDITESSLKELVADYIRKDFRETLFRS